LTISAAQNSPEWLSVRRRSKWFLDVPVSVLLMLVTLPLAAVIALLIKLTSPGPVLLRQMRTGQYGEPFLMLKFRTIHCDAHGARGELVRRGSTGGRHLFKMRHDPRITPVGRILRRLSLDELPQLVNVLRGEMALVGPRPLLVEDSDYEGQARDRLLVPPGLTGLWQVSGRSNLPWEEMVRLDLHYIANVSLRLDAIILIRTVIAVLTARGAY